MAVILGALIPISCERSKDTEGPRLQDLYGEFSVFQDFEASSPNVDFSAGGSMFFTGVFSKTVAWQVTITGQTTGAVKVMEGFGSTLDELSARWLGDITTLPMMKVEACEVILSVPNESFADTININVQGIKSNEGFLVADFETPINPGWQVFIQGGADMSFFIDQSDSSAQGTGYYDMGGEVDWDYLIGYIYFPASAYQLPTYPLDDNPANVYFNVFLNVPEGISNEIVLFQFLEDENGDGNHQATSEDMYSLELKGLSSGWQMISLRYDELIALANGIPSPPAGNDIHEPHKLLDLRLLFLADPATGYSQTYLDYVIFTESSPLQP